MQIADTKSHRPKRSQKDPNWIFSKDSSIPLKPQAAQTLFVIYIRDSIALCFEPFKRMYENGSKIALNSTFSKGFK